MTLPYITFYKPSLDNYIRNFVKYLKFEERERERKTCMTKVYVRNGKQRI